MGSWHGKRIRVKEMEERSGMWAEANSKRFFYVTKQL